MAGAESAGKGEIREQEGTFSAPDDCYIYLRYPYLFWSAKVINFAFGFKALLFRQSFTRRGLPVAHLNIAPCIPHVRHFCAGKPRRGKRKGQGLSWKKRLCFAEGLRVFKQLHHLPLFRWSRHCEMMLRRWLCLLVKPGGQGKGSERTDTVVQRT